MTTCTSLLFSKAKLKAAIGLDPGTYMHIYRSSIDTPFQGTVLIHTHNVVYKLNTHIHTHTHTLEHTSSALFALLTSPLYFISVVTTSV